MEENNKIFCYKELKNQYKKYNLKSLILPKLGLDETYKLETIEDFSNLQIKYGEKFPYNNIDVINGITSITDIDYIVESIVKKESGNNCIPLNILFGMLLQEFDGVSVKLVKIIENSNIIDPKLSLHHLNVMEFQNKQYLIESCLTMFSNYYPIELGDEIGKVIPGTSNIFIRVIKHQDGTFIYQQQKKILPDEDAEYLSIYSFKLDNIIPINNIINECIHYNEWITSNNYGLVLYLKFNQGFYYYAKGELTIQYNNGKKDLIKVNNNTQLSKIISKYFKIKNLKDKNYQLN